MVGKWLKNTAVSVGLAANAPVAYYSHQVGVDQGMKQASKVVVEIAPEGLWVKDQSERTEYAKKVNDDLVKDGHNSEVDFVVYHE